MLEKIKAALRFWFYTLVGGMLLILVALLMALPNLLLGLTFIMSD